MPSTDARASASAPGRSLSGHRIDRIGVRVYQIPTDAPESDGIAYPGRQVVAFVGDGGFSMLMADFVTAVKHELPIKVVVIKNDVLGQIKWEQMVFLGNPESGVELAPIDFVKVAEACGGRGVRIDDPTACADQVRAALDKPGPVPIEAVVGALEAPMPGRVNFEQAQHFAASILRGQPDRGAIVATNLGERVRELV